LSTSTGVVGVEATEVLEALVLEVELVVLWDSVVLEVAP